MGLGHWEPSTGPLTVDVRPRTLSLLVSALSARGLVLQEVLHCSTDNGGETALVVTVSCGVISPPGNQAGLWQPGYSNNLEAASQ